MEVRTRHRMGNNPAAHRCWIDRGWSATDPGRILRCNARRRVASTIWPALALVLRVQWWLCAARSTYALLNGVRTELEVLRGLSVDHEHGGIHAQHLFDGALQVRELFDVLHADNGLGEVVDLVAHLSQHVRFHAVAVEQAAQRVGNRFSTAEPNTPVSRWKISTRAGTYINEIVSSITSTSEGHSGFSMLFFNSAVRGVVSFKFNFFLAAASSATLRNRLCTGLKGESSLDVKE